MSKFSFTILLLYFFSFFEFLTMNFLFSQSMTDVSPISLSDELPYQINITASGKIFISGRVSTFLSEECYISKHDKDGNFLWAKIIGGMNYDYFQKSIALNDQIICGGNTNSFGQNFQDFYLVNFNQNGDTLWTKVSGGSKYDKLSDIIPNGNNILSAGYSNSFGSASNNDILLINTDSSGNPLWAKSFEANGEDILHSIKKLTDGSFIIIGNTTSFGAGMKDIFCLKTDSLGNFNWLKTFGGPDDEDAIELIVENKNIYITGYTKSFSGSQDLWIIKMDSIGNLLWNKVIDFGLNEKGNKIFYKNGKVFICGYMQSMTGTMDDIFVLSIDESGANISTKQFSITGSEFGNFIGESNGKLFIAGYQTNNSKMKIFEIDDSLFSCNSSTLAFDTLSMPVTITDTFFIVNSIPIDSVIQNKGGDLADNGNPAVAVDMCLLPLNSQESVAGKSGIKIFPNPNDGKFQLTIDNWQLAKGELEIYNILWAPIFKSQYSFEVHRSNIQYSFNFPSGIYFLKITATEFTKIEKFIVRDF